MQEDPSTKAERAFVWPLRGNASRWLIVAVLVAALCWLAMQLPAQPGSAAAQATTPAQSGRFLAVGGQITGDSYGLYLIDKDNGIITVYQWLPRSRKLRLLAARNIRFDLQLDEYNTEPSPSEIRKLVRQSQRLDSLEPK